MNSSKRLKITVFGGASPKRGEPAYQDAYSLGRYLGSEGYSVLTGGYIGTMEAVSRGVVEGGGRTIGVTCDEIENWRPTGPNAWVQEEIRLVTVQDRLSTLVTESDAAIALPGGIGTMTEIMLTLNLLSVSAITPRPLVVVGQGWRETLTGFFNAQFEYIPTSQRDCVTFARDNQEVFEFIFSWKEKYYQKDSGKSYE